MHLKAFLFILLLPVILTGCNRYKNPELLFVQPTVGKYGNVKGFRLNERYSLATDQVDRQFATTLDPHALMFVLPTENHFKLGTVIMGVAVKGHGNESFYDDGIVASVAKNKLSRQYTGAVRFGMIQEQVLRASFQPEQIRTIHNELRDVRAPQSAYSISVLLEHMDVETISRKNLIIIQEHLNQFITRDRPAYFAVVDKVIRASEILYLYPPRIIKKLGLEATFNTLAQVNENVFFDGGVWYVRQRFNRKKVVALGASLLPSVTNVGDNRIRSKFTTLFFDSYLFSGKKTNKIFP